MQEGVSLNPQEKGRKSREPRAFRNLNEVWMKWEVNFVSDTLPPRPEPPLTLDSLGPKMNSSKLCDHSTRQVPVEFLHRVIENLVSTGKDDFGGALSDSRNRVRGWALFPGPGAVLHRWWRGRLLGLPFHELSSTEAVGRTERTA